MPELPVFLADFMEPRFARPVVVSHVEDLAKQLRRVRFQGESLRSVRFTPGQEIEFRVSDRAFRHYTPARFDAEAGEVEVVFFLHGHGPGSRWAEALAVGSPAKVLGPGGNFGLTDADKHVLLGDETALGLFHCLEAAGASVLGAVELDRGNEDWLSRVGASALEPVTRTGARGDALSGWLRGCGLSPEARTSFYLAGHTASIVRLRKELVDAGWQRGRIRTKPYWADGKRGL
jgi:NADPH-dependent ferric siderophore reductase